MMGRLIAVLLIGALLISWLGYWVFIIPAVILLVWLIRWIADIFWWGKDKGKW